MPSPGGIIESKLKEKECKEYVESYKIEEAQRKSTQKMAVSLEALSSQAEEGNLRELNLIIKADVNGSLEAIKSSIEKIESQDIPIKIIHASTGSITENDVMLAKASNGIVFGFNSDANNEAKKVAEAEKIIVKSYSIIYEILDNIERVIKGLYKPEFEEIEMAQLEVRQLFKFSKVGIIAGCYVTSGKIDRNCKVKVLRGKNEEYNGDIDSLKRFKEDVKEVSHGFECGVVLPTDNIKEGDIIYAYKIQEKESYLVMSRQDRISSLLKAELSKLIHQKINDSRIGFISITDVTISKDNQHAWVYYSQIGSDEQKEQTKRG